MLDLKWDLLELCFGGLVMKSEICGSDCCCSEDVGEGELYLWGVNIEKREMAGRS